LWRGVATSAGLGTIRSERRHDETVYIYEDHLDGHIVLHLDISELAEVCD
jgi:hypothetical protein